MFEISNPAVNGGSDCEIEDGFMNYQASPFDGDEQCEKYLKDYGEGIFEYLPQCR